MPKGKTVRLRIYCICGQKMKVSPSMYGRPGKCVACRQKIRIPREEEIPPNAREIHLRDHPEFLRRPPIPAGLTPVDLLEDIPSEPESLPLGTESPREITIPLDVLEPLRMLVSLEAKLRRQQEALEGVESNAKSGARRAAERAGQRARVKHARRELDDFMRQQLMEAAIELATVQEKLTEVGLGVRVGELEFPAYQSEVDELRRRRDRLERRQQNLRGWLAVQDPYMAGGYVDVTPEQALTDRRLALPREPEWPEGLLESYVRELRETLEKRERAERKVKESERLPAPKEVGGAPLPDARADAAASLKRIRAAVVYYTQRIEQLQNDYKSDLEAIESQLDLARGRLQVGEIDRNRFDQVEKDLLRAKMDLSKALDLAKRALLASGSGDVPSTRGSYLRRMTPPRPPADTGAGSASALGWMAAAALIASLFVPVIDADSPLRAYARAAGIGSPEFGAVLGPGLAALVALVAGFFPSRTVRGLAYSVATVIALAAALPLAAKGFPLLQPATGLWVFAAILLVTAGFVALWPFRSLRFAPVGALLVVAVLAGAVVASNTSARPAAELGMGPRPANATAAREPARDTGPDAEPAESDEASDPDEPVSDPFDATPEVEFAPVPPPPPALIAAPGEPETPAPPALDPDSVQAELQGILSAPDRPARFSIALTVPGQPPRSQMYAVGETVFGDWKVREHNSYTQTVTLAGNDRILVLRRGEPVVLEELPQ